MRNRMLLSVVVAVSVCLASWTTTVSAKDEKPDATVEFNGGSAAAGVGLSWGAGVIKYKGRSYAFKVNGLSVGTVGLSQASGSGEVFHLKSLDDFNGTYVAAGVGLTVAGGGGVATMKNQNGVTMDVKATTRGAKVAIAGSGVSIELLK